MGNDDLRLSQPLKMTIEADAPRADKSGRKGEPDSEMAGLQKASARGLTSPERRATLNQLLQDLQQLERLD